MTSEQTLGISSFTFKCVSLLIQTFLMRVCVCAPFLLQKAVITNVSPDILYLFRVQAVCQHDLRSDFSQTLLFRGSRSQPSSYSVIMSNHSTLFVQIWCMSFFNLLLVTANTTRIFQGSRIVKTGMVSWPEDGTANFFFHVGGIYWVHMNNHFFLCLSPSAHNVPSIPSRHGSNKLWLLHLDILWHPLLHCLHGNGDGSLL